MDTNFTNDLMKKLDLAIIENTDDYLTFEWEKIAKEQMTNFDKSSAVSYIDKLIYGYTGFKKYKYDRLLFNVLYYLASKNDAEAIELLLEYLKGKDRRGFAAEALGRLKEKRAVGIIVEVLRDSLIFSPKSISYMDAWDRITLSSYVYMIGALKSIGEAEPGVLRILEDYSNKVEDKEIRRDSKEALDSLLGKS